MTTIRISRLPEIRNDRMSKDDFIIVNDGDIITSKINFEEFVTAIGAMDNEYTGDLLFTGDVVFEGSVTGDFYNKDQTYSKAEINQLIANLEDYNVIQDARITALVNLSGLPELSEDLGTFPLLANCAFGGEAADLDNLTVKDAFVEIRDYTKENRCEIARLDYQVTEIRLELDDLTDRVDQIEIEINGNIGGGPPDPGGPPPDGILPWLRWLTIKVNEHEMTLIDHEQRIVILEQYKDELETIIIPDLTDRLLINDNENAALITLSGAPQYATDLGTFTYSPVPHPGNNETFRSNSLNNKTIKAAFQEVLDQVRTRAGIDDPIFVNKITGPKQSSSVIPFYYATAAQLSGASGADGDLASAEGAFAYTRNDNPINVDEPKAWVRAQTEWLQILTSGNFSAIIDTLNLRTAKNDAEASALSPPVGDGFLYVQYDPAKPLEQPLLKVNGVNSAANPRP